MTDQRRFRTHPPTGSLVAFRRARVVAGLLVSLSLGACMQTERFAADSQKSDAAAAPSTGDTVYRVDTVMRIDTVFVIDTVVALGTPSANAVAPAPAENPAGGEQPVTEDDLRYLRSRDLIVPVAGISAAAIPSSFADKRGSRQHNAIDILAPRGTPVLAADDGILAKIDTSAGGGLSLYIAGPQERFIYYYAHLDAYRRGIKEGMRISKGDTIGYVGTTGNAPANTPHLHFAIARADRDKRWWKGTPLNPFPVWAAS